MNIFDYLILAAVAAAVINAVRISFKNKRKGKCSCGCSGCNSSCTRS